MKSLSKYSARAFSGFCKSLKAANKLQYFKMRKNVHKKEKIHRNKKNSLSKLMIFHINSSIYLYIVVVMLGWRFFSLFGTAFAQQSRRQLFPAGSYMRE